MPRYLLLVLVLTACDLNPLTREELFGPVTPTGRDSSPPPPPADAGSPTDATPHPDEAPPVGQTAPLSGQVVDSCTRQAISANVGIASQHTCSTDNIKAYYFFRDVPVGVTLRLAASKKGYVSYMHDIVVQSNGSTHDIALVPEGGCLAPTPPTEVCVCEMPNCVRS